MKAPLVFKTRSKTDRERYLILLLRITGVLMMAALVFCFCPFAWMNSIHQMMGMGELADTPILRYLTRSLSGMYAYLGTMLLFISFDIHRHRSFLRFIAGVGIVAGVGVFLLDYSAGLPALWTWSEGPLTILLCAIILYLSR